MIKICPFLGKDCLKNSCALYLDAEKHSSCSFYANTMMMHNIMHLIEGTSHESEDK